MSNSENMRKGFIHSGEAHYAPAVLPIGKVEDEVCISFYSVNGGTAGEFLIAWERMPDGLVPRLKAYDDSWRVLYQCQDLLQAMSDMDNQHVTPLAFCERLKALGYDDLTPR